ncbi:MAG: STAS-like domain-containing protein [Candidatus Polarisedimenticolaceae bacterium]|nr:STAS-like domain-containing protein [Candidatus Polarisedimenticolaceae bacterium]
MNTSLTVLRSGEQNSFLGTRFHAQPIREQLEECLARNEVVTIDFSGVSGVTQSFIDELLGRIVLEQGADIIDRMRFKGCTSDLQTIIQVVLGRRARDYKEKNTH